MDLAKSLDAADTYIELSRENPDEQFAQIKDNTYGFDIVVEATGSVKILEDAINYVRRGGTLVVYGVYASSAKISWPPAKIFGDEITIGSFSKTYMFLQLPLSTTSTPARSKPRASSTRRSSSRTLARRSKASRKRAPSRLPSCSTDDGVKQTCRMRLIDWIYRVY